MTIALIWGHLFSMLLAGLPALHHWLHDDSDELGHQCAVTTVLDGQIDRSTELPLAAMPPDLGRGTALFLGSVTESLVAPHSAVRDRAPPLT